MTKRLLVTGARGFVAGSVLSQAGTEWEVHAVSRGAAGAGVPEQIGWHTYDTRSPAALNRLLHRIRPAAVIHTAAIAAIDYCEAHPDEAVEANVQFTERLAAGCREVDARLIFLSTDNVFDGETGGYCETDPPSPINVYGRTKADAETRVTDLMASFVVARVSVVMGLPMIGAGNSFLARVVADLQAGATIGTPDTEIRTPIDVITLGRALLELAGHPFCGILHLSGSDTVNRLALIRRIAAHLGFDPSRVVANQPERIPGRAPRPRDISLQNRLARSVLQTPFPGLEDALDLIRGRHDGKFRM